MWEDSILEDFLKVCKLARINLSKEDIIVEKLLAGPTHVTYRLPKNKMAIYIFINPKSNICYKVGLIGGMKSNDRFQRQHYSPNSTNSNLAKSILNDKDIDCEMMNVKDWIINNTERINIFIDAKWGILTLKLLECFIQNRLQPKYEGFKSQR